MHTKKKRNHQSEFHNILSALFFHNGSSFHSIFKYILWKNGQCTIDRLSKELLLSQKLFALCLKNYVVVTADWLLAASIRLFALENTLLMLFARPACL